MKETELLELLDNMTLEEKVYQLVQLDGGVYSENTAITGPQGKLGINDDVIENMGSVFNIMGAGELKKIQEDHLKHNRNKIPLLFLADFVYGYKTVLPIPLGFACSWNPDLVKSGMEMIAREATSAGVHGVFSPVADLVRDPRWGRVMESTGEDPYLSSVYAKAEVEGFQGNLDQKYVASCVKHFAAYGASEAGRDYNTVDMSERRLRQDYLPAYKAAIEAGCKMVMPSFNIVDGIPATGNKWLLGDVLRDEWDFNGVINSDYAGIKELIYHGFAVDEDHAAKLGIEAGVDFDMKTPVYANHLKRLVENKKVNEKLLDESVLRILQLKNDLGLFEDPYRGADEQFEKEELYSEKNRSIALSLAQESIVLLKNDKKTLPLENNEKIALIGPYANETSLVGVWAFAAESNITTLKTAMENKFGDNVSYAYGCDILDDSSSLGDFGFTVHEKAEKRDSKKDLENALDIASEADTIVVALGEHTFESGEAASKTDLTLNKTQIELLDELAKLNKPIVCVLFNGRPLVLDGILDKVDALVEAWFPGTEGAIAVADILKGDVNPSGKLTFSFPMNVGQIPVYYNQFKTGRPIIGSGHSSKFVSKYLDVGNEPRYHFGYGLSYTDFDYSSIQLNSDVLRKNDSIQASVTVKNIGDVKGKETVQLYIQDVTGSVVRPVKELKGFKKIELKPQESRQIVFTITEEDLKFFTSEMRFEAEAGKFKLFIGKDSREVQETAFEFIKE